MNVKTRTRFLLKTSVSHSICLIRIIIQSTAKVRLEQNRKSLDQLNSLSTPHASSCLSRAGREMKSNEPGKSTSERHILAAGQARKHVTSCYRSGLNRGEGGLYSSVSTLSRCDPNFHMRRYQTSSKRMGRTCDLNADCQVKSTGGSSNP